MQKFLPSSVCRFVVHLPEHEDASKTPQLVGCQSNHNGEYMRRNVMSQESKERKSVCAEEGGGGDGRGTRNPHARQGGVGGHSSGPTSTHPCGGQDVIPYLTQLAGFAVVYA